jgi:hypothetical protein
MDLIWELVKILSTGISPSQGCRTTQTQTKRFVWAGEDIPFDRFLWFAKYENENTIFLFHFSLQNNKILRSVHSYVEKNT